MTPKLHFILPIVLLLIVPAFSVKRIDVPLQATPGADETQDSTPTTITSPIGQVSRKSAIASQDRSNFLKFDPAGNPLSKASIWAQDDDSLDSITVSGSNAKEDDDSQQNAAGDAANQTGDDTPAAKSGDGTQPAGSVGDNEPTGTQATTKDSAKGAQDDDYDDDTFLTNDDKIDYTPVAPQADEPDTANGSKDDQSTAPATSKDAEPASKTSKKDDESAAPTEDTKPAAKTESKDSEPAASTDDNTESTVPVSTEKSSGMLKGILLTMCLVSGVILMAFVCYYRYQLEKYKIPPFTPPMCCPNCLFPRTFDRNKGTQSESYQMIEVYNPPELSSRF